MSSRSNTDLSYPYSPLISESEDQSADSYRRRGKRNRLVYFSDERRRRSGRIREPDVDLFSAFPNGVVCWNSLKKLLIGCAELSEDVIQNILAGSPVLGILELYEFYGFNRLHISNVSVKKLILRNGCDEVKVREEYRIGGGYHCLLEISAPHLHSLEISKNLGDKICRLGDVSSLVDAKLNFSIPIGSVDYYYEMYKNMLKGLLQSIVHVKKLTLGSWAIEVPSIMEFKGLRSPLLKCECLTLNTTGIRKSSLPGIAHMLESSPHLETLVISMLSYTCGEEMLDHFKTFCKVHGHQQFMLVTKGRRWTILKAI